MQNRLTFNEAVNLTLACNYHNFESRASRSEFWWWALFCGVVVAVEHLVVVMLGYSIGHFVAALLTLIFSVPTAAIIVRRLHDIGRSGWWALVGLIPVVGWLLLIYWLARPSHGAINAYGVAPFTDFD